METTTQLIDARPTRAGQSRAFIAGTRVRVLDIYAMAELQGLSPDEIIHALPHLTLAQVHAALAHYFANRDEIVRQLREEEEPAWQLHASTGPGPIESGLPGGRRGVVRFHLDESVHGGIATALRHRGIDVSMAAEVGLIAAGDEQHLEFACSQGRVVVTHDSDFLQLHMAGTPHAGIAYCAPGRRTVGHLVRLLCLMHDCLSAEEMRGRVEYL